MSYVRKYAVRRVSQCDPLAPKLSECANNLQQFFGRMNNHFFGQELFQGHRYTSKDKAQIFLTQLDHDYYTEAIDEILIDINISTMRGDGKIRHKHLTFPCLPATVKHVARKLHCIKQQLYQKVIREAELKFLKRKLRLAITQGPYSKSSERKHIGTTRKRIGIHRKRSGLIFFKSSHNLNVVLDIFQRDHLNKDIDKMCTSPKPALTVVQNIYSRHRLNKNIDKYLFNVFQRDRLNKNIDKDKNDENPLHLVQQTKQ